MCCWRRSRDCDRASKIRRGVTGVMEPLAQSRAKLFLRCTVGVRSTISLGDIVICGVTTVDLGRMVLSQDGIYLCLIIAGS